MTVEWWHHVDALSCCCGEALLSGCCIGLSCCVTFHYNAVVLGLLGWWSVVLVLVSGLAFFMCCVGNRL